MESTHDSTAGQSAYEATAAEREAITEVVPNNFDIAQAYDVVVANAPRLEQFADELAVITAFDPTLPKRAITYANAAVHAAMLERFAPPSMSKDESDAVALCVELYPKFFSTAESLVKESLLPATVMAAAATGLTHRDRVHAMNRFVFAFRAHESVIVNNSTIKRETIEKVANAVAIALPALSARDLPSDAQRDAARERMKSAMLLFHAWNQTRRAMHWLRWEEQDADQWAPSFFSQRGARSEKSKPDTDSNPASKPVAPVTPVAPVAPAKPVEGAAKPLVPQDDPFIR